MKPSRNAAETALSSGAPSPLRSIVASSAYSDSFPIAVRSSTRACGITSSGPTITTERSSGRPPFEARSSSTSSLTRVTTSFASSGEHGFWSQAANSALVRDQPARKSGYDKSAPTRRISSYECA